MTVGTAIASPVIVDVLLDSLTRRTIGLTWKAPNHHVAALLCSLMIPRKPLSEIQYKGNWMIVTPLQDSNEQLTLAQLRGIVRDVLRTVGPTMSIELHPRVFNLLP